MDCLEPVVFRWVTDLPDAGRKHVLLFRLSGLVINGLTRCVAAQLSQRLGCVGYGSDLQYGSDVGVSDDLVDDKVFSFLEQRCRKTA